MMKTILRLVICFFFFWITNSNCQSKIKLIKKGSYIPLYGNDSTTIHVNSFYMDVYPVTNKEYLEFVKKNPTWRRSKILRLFADKRYLNNWQNDTVLAANQKLKSPITDVSWFAAKAYCEEQGKRLPTINEWEYVAMADEKLRDARKSAAYNQYILSWYEKRKTANRIIGSTFKNYWGIYDLHGLVWEWTQDFNSVLLSGESRKDVDDGSNLFCGKASLDATDLRNYAAFMRYAIRGSLKAKYTMKNLGFRCVKNKK